MPLADPAPPAPRPSRFIAPGVALIAVCYGIARFAYGLFVPAFRAEFALSDTLLGVIAAGSYVGYCAAIVVAAAAVSRMDPRAVAVAAGGVAAVGMALIAAATHPVMLAAAVLLAGSSTGLASPPLAQILARRIPAQAHDRAQAVVNAGPGLGIALSAPVALLAVGHWRLAWLAFAVIAGLVTLWVGFALHPHRSTLTDRGHLLTTATRRGSLRLVTGAALFGASSACVWTFARDHVTTAGGLSDASSILLWITLGLAGLAGAAGGDLVARHGLPAVWRAGLLTAAVATIALGVAPGRIATAFIAMALFGAAYMTLTIVVFFWALDSDPRQPAASIGLGFLMITVGQALGAPLAGLLVEHSGAAGAFSAFAALSALTAVLTGPPSGGRESSVRCHSGTGAGPCDEPQPDVSSRRRATRSVRAPHRRH